jgi:DNA-binding Xre family transcriptional regulator
MSPMMDIAAEVRAELARRRMSWRDLALQTNIPTSTMHRRLTTGQDWRIDELLRVCNHLGLSLPELLRRSERMAASA